MKWKVEMESGNGKTGNGNGNGTKNAPITGAMFSSLVSFPGSPLAGRSWKRDYLVITLVFYLAMVI